MVRFATSLIFAWAADAARIQDEISAASMTLEGTEDTILEEETVDDAIAADADARFLVTVPSLGELQGRSAYRRDRSVAVFRGIPYAQAPVGDLRWRAPQPYGPWDSPRDALDYRDSCMGAGANNNPSSEDCLFLNVATPRTAIGDASAQHTVMIWIHGGSYLSGASNEFEIENIVYYAVQPVVVASMNYRINVFGFFGSQALADLSPEEGTGNYGLQDTRLAITWMRDHVSAFGGNGGDMTLFGESAGGNAVLHHLAQPASAGLFQKAIIQSGTYDAGYELSDAQAIFDGVSAQLGCADVDCLLSKSAQEVMESTTAWTSTATEPEVHWGPVVDGVSNSGSAQELIADGHFNRDIPVLIGSNIDEFALFLLGNTNASYARDMTEAGFDHLMGYIGAENLRTLKQAYDPSVYEYPANLGSSSEWWWKAMRVATDNGIPFAGFSKGVALGHCSMRRVAHNLIQGGVPSLHMYSFNKVLMGDAVAHAVDVPFVFAMNNLGSFPLPQMNLRGYKELSKAMIEYWTSFAITGEPYRHQSGLTPWPEYTLDGDRPNLRLDGSWHSTDITIEHGLRQQACDFWDDFH